MRPTAILLRLIRYSPVYFTLCLLFGIIVFFCVPIPLGLATQAFFNAASHSGPVGLNGWTAIAIIVGAMVGESIAGPLLAAPWSPVQQKSHLLMRKNMFAGILRRYGRNGLPLDSGEVVSRFRDDPVIIADTIDSLCDLIGRSLFAIVAGALMWRINPVITLALFVPLLLSSLLTQLLSSRIMDYRTAARIEGGNLTRFLGDIMGAHLALKVNGAIPHAVTRLSEIGESRRRAEVRDSVFAAMLDGWSLNLGGLGTGVLLLLVSGSIRSGAFTVGDLALFVVFLDALGWLPEEVSRMFGGLKRINISYGRMLEAIPSEPAEALVLLKEARPDGRQTGGSNSLDRLDHLQVTGLSYAYPSGKDGIRDVSFTMQRGTLTVVTGRIGSGKSTLLQTIVGLLPAWEGTVQWNGRRIDDVSTFLVPPRCGYTPQVPRLLSDTLRENILLGRSEDPSALEAAIESAALSRDVALLKAGIHTVVGPRGVKLSGGQIQRVAAARMLFPQPELLIVDDLSSALDVETEVDVWDGLLRDRRHTVLAVSHRPLALDRADQILRMEGGYIAERWTKAPSRLS